MKAEVGVMLLQAKGGPRRPANHGTDRRGKTAGSRSRPPGRTSSGDPSILALQPPELRQAPLLLKSPALWDTVAVGRAHEYDGVTPVMIHPRLSSRLWTRVSLSTLPASLGQPAVPRDHTVAATDRRPGEGPGEELFLPHGSHSEKRDPFWELPGRRSLPSPARQHFRLR